MRIAVWHNLPSGGGKRCLFDQVKALVARNHYLEAWCPPSASQDFLPLANLIRENVVEREKRERPKSKLMVSRWMSSELRSMDRHCADCAREIDRQRFDVVLVHPCMYYRSIPIARHLKTPALLYLPEPYRWLYEALPTPPFMALPGWDPSVWGRSPHHYAKAYLLDLVDTQARRNQVRAEYESARAFRRILVNSFYSRESVLRAA